MRLHPEWSSPKVSVYPLDGYAEPLHPPKRGLGRSDGGKGVPKEFQGEETETGTFSLFKNFGVLKTLKFDHRKAPSI